MIEKRKTLSELKEDVDLHVNCPVPGEFSAYESVDVLGNAVSELLRREMKSERKVERLKRLLVEIVEAAQSNRFTNNDAEMTEYTTIEYRLIRRCEKALVKP